MKFLTLFWEAATLKKESSWVIVTGYLMIYGLGVIGGVLGSGAMIQKVLGGEAESFSTLLFFAWFFVYCFVVFAGIILNKRRPNYGKMMEE